MPHTLPIFPLNAVLFPGGLLPLRIFEARYTDMVRDCMREESEFGICLIRKGQEVGLPAEPEVIGCQARIIDWNMEQVGVLQITTLGTTRFRIVEQQVQPNGLVVAETEALEDEMNIAVPPQFQACTELLDSIITQLDTQTDGSKFPIAQPYRLDDATWVGNRLSEVLPIPLQAKQKLMALTDAATRLSIVHQFLVQKKIV